MSEPSTRLLDRLLSSPPIIPSRGPLRLLARYELVLRAIAVPFQVWFEDLQASKAYWPLLVPALLLYAAYRWRVERRELVRLAQQIIASEERNGLGA